VLQNETEIIPIEVKGEKVSPPLPLRSMSVKMNRNTLYVFQNGDYIS